MKKAGSFCHSIQSNKTKMVKSESWLSF